MPWSIEDVEEHKKGLSEKQKRKWVKIANRVLQRCRTVEDKSEDECAEEAIRTANSEVGE